MAVVAGGKARLHRVPGLYREHVKNELWRPLSERSGTPAPTLRTTISRSLETQLRHWLFRAMEAEQQLADRITLRCDLKELHSCRAHGLAEDEPEDTETQEDLDVVHLAYCTPAKQLPDVIDTWLDLTPETTPKPIPGLARSNANFDLFASVTGYLMPRARLRRDLQQLLDDARSTYTLRPDHRGLRHRVDPTVEALAIAAATSASNDPERGSAGAHLNRAWTAAYALHPDPVKAYSETIKAVEAAAHATVEPNNRKATLGSMIKVLENTRARWVVGIGHAPSSNGAETVERMMRLLWTGQTSRHGGSHPTRDETLAEARAAVNLAVALLSFFTDGLLYQAPSAP